MIRFLVVVAFLATLLPSPINAAKPGDVIPGPLEAEVLRVLDGDTFEARVFIWPGQTVITSVRLDGLDTPEKHAKCASERAMAQIATKRLGEMLYRGALLKDVQWGKYAGRVLARVYSAGGSDVAEAMIKEGLARRYTGDAARKPWC